MFIVYIYDKNTAIKKVVMAIFELNTKSNTCRYLDIHKHTN